MDNCLLLKPKIDVVFHALFRDENKKLTENFISDILGQKINIKTTDLDRHLNIKEADQKLGVMDLRTELEDGTKCNIEIQLNAHECEIEKFLYYWADTYSRQLQRGEQYSELNKTISIIILDHEIDVLKGIDKLDVKWQIRENKYSHRALTDHLEMCIIELPKAKRLYSKLHQDKICQWMMFLDDPNQEEVTKIMKDNKGINDAVQELKQVSNDERLRRITQLKEKKIRDDYAALRYAQKHGFNTGYENGMKAGLEDGTKKGIEEGIREGIREGLKQGIQEGIQEEKVNIAKNMLNKNMDISTIIEITGLSKEYILKLK